MEILLIPEKLIFWFFFFCFFFVVAVIKNTLSLNDQKIMKAKEMMNWLDERCNEIDGW